ncbi:MAG: Asp-tRNA(Asn)/Glu-tRNA(Gln) amidotransferase subunit GatC [Gemmatimonadota bacterium]
MKIGPEEVMHVARLAELAVTEDELPRLVAQLGRIVEYVAQLDQVPSSAEAPPFLAGPISVALREDVVNPIPLARSPSEMAPEFRHGFFVVPRLGSMEGS